MNPKKKRGAKDRDKQYKESKDFILYNKYFYNPNKLISENENEERHKRQKIDETEVLKENLLESDDIKADPNIKAVKKLKRTQKLIEKEIMIIEHTLKSEINNLKDIKNTKDLRKGN